MFTGRFRGPGTDLASHLLWGGDVRLRVLQTESFIEPLTRDQWLRENTRAVPPSNSYPRSVPANSTADRLWLTRGPIHRTLSSNDTQ
jgi:hypothetical protein